MHHYCAWKKSTDKFSDFSIKNDYNMLHLPRINDHVAVCVKNHIIVFAGRDIKHKTLSLHNLWMYNVDTEQWRKHVIPHGKDVPPGTVNSCAVVIKGAIYMFGGWVPPDPSHYTNAVWKLTITPEQCFKWRKCMARIEKKTPSPRQCHSTWEYKGKLWTFGGHGPSLENYLNDHGDFSSHMEIHGYGQNNQLLCYNLLSEDWRNLKPSGTIPEPCSCHASTISGDKVWVYGGFNTNTSQGCDELYQLNMVSLTWTEIQCGQLKPPYRSMCSLTAVTENQILLHGGVDVCASYETFNDTWIFDLSSLSWKKIYEASKGKPRSGHTGNVSMNGSVIIIGGLMFVWNENGHIGYRIYNDVFSVKLEPKTLQQLAIHKIYHHQDVLPWKLMPNSLKSRFLFPVAAAKKPTKNKNNNNKNHAGLLLDTSGVKSC